MKRGMWHVARRVQLSRQMEAAAKEFQEFKRTKEKEMMQLR